MRVMKNSDRFVIKPSFTLLAKVFLVATVLTILPSLCHNNGSVDIPLDLYSI
jgi:hypothetical protein